MAPGRRASLSALLALMVLALIGSACAASGTGDDGRGLGSTGAPLCPVRPLDVVVTVDQWGSLVEAVAGSCGRVTSLVSGSVDPHDYEPTPADAAALDRADVIILNGLGYDAWAQRAIDARSPQPVVLDIGGGWDAAAGADPHLWYAPGVVNQTIDRIAEVLDAAAPGASTHVAEQVARLRASLAPYNEAIGALRSSITAAPDGPPVFAATEPVFDQMATTVGLVDGTPAGFARAVSNHGEPSPGDVAEFMDALADGSVDVLIVNVQSSSSMTDRLREQAEAHDVPVVEVTETVAPGADGFIDWQVAQLHALTDALGTPR